MSIAGINRTPLVEFSFSISMVFLLRMFEDKNAVQALVTIVKAPLGPGVGLVIVRLSRSEAMLVLARRWKRLHHFSLHKVGVELVQLRQPEVPAIEIRVRKSRLDCAAVSSSPKIKAAPGINFHILSFMLSLLLYGPFSDSCFAGNTLLPGA